MDPKTLINQSASDYNYNLHEPSAVTKESSGKYTPNYIAITKGFVVFMFLVNFILTVRYIQLKSYANRVEMEKQQLSHKYKEQLSQLSQLKQLQENQSKNYEQNEFAYLQKKYFPYLLNEPDKCKDDEGKALPVFLLVIIKSLPKNFRRRKAIRLTWGNESLIEGIIVKRLFLLATDGDAKRQLLVNLESEVYEDILQGNFEEHFRNLTKKDVMFFRWLVNHCPQAKYIYKGDDDMFMNIFNIIDYLLSRNPKATKELFVGSLLYPSKRINDPKSKYYVPSNVYAEKIYPPYLSGGGFVMSTVIAKKLFLVMLSTTVIPIDDAFLGICLKKLGIRPQQHKGFKSWEKRWKSFDVEKAPHRICYLQDVMTIHHLEGGMLIQAWKLLLTLMKNPRNFAIQCSTEFQVKNNTVQRAK